MTPLEHVEPLHCIGESHCLRFRDRLGRHASLLRPLHPRAHFLVHVEASNFTGAGGLNPDLAAALLAAELCVERLQADGTMELEAAHRATTFAHRVLAARHAALADEPLVAPALLLFAGDKELHSLATQIGPGVDFELPQDPGYGWIAGAERIPFATVETTLAGRLQPLLTGLEMLRTAGFTRTMLHGLAPRCRDDDRVARWCSGIRIAATVRSKLAVAANRLLARECGRLGIGFVDVWQDLQQDGYLAPQFDLDGVHGNDAATAVTFASVARCLGEVSRGDLNPAQYELLTELAPERAMPVDPAAAAFAERGWSSHTAADLGRQAPASANAEHLHAAVLSPAVHGALACAWNFEVGACLAHMARDLGALATAAAPIGVRQAMWSMRGTAVLRVVDRLHGRAATATLSAGSLLVFDPQRVEVRGEAASDDAEALVLDLLPRLPGESPQVVIVDGAAWPADPFRITASVDAVAPPFRASVWRRWTEVVGRTIPGEVAAAGSAAALVGSSAG